jgi:hypothetical protein
MDLLVIGSYTPPAPVLDGWEGTVSDLDGEGTGRAEDASLHRQRIYAGAQTLRYKWTGLTVTELRSILGAVSPASFSVTFFDPAEEDYTTTKTMYAGDRKYKPQKFVDLNHPEDSIWELTVDLIDYCSD